jgi:hypothetical protein
MNEQLVWWPVLVVVGLLALSLVIFLLGFWKRRRTAPFSTRVILVAISLLPLIAAIYFWGYYGFYSID